MASIFGFNFPFYSESSVLPTQTDLKIIRNDVKQLLLTGIGERVMRPSYGTLIRAFPFEPMTQASINNLKSNIADAISAFESRVIVRDIVVNGIEEENLIEISIILSLSGSPQTTFDVDLTLAASSVTTSRSQL